MEREIERDQRRKKVETYPSKEITISITNLIKRDSHQKRFFSCYSVKELRSN